MNEVPEQNLSRRWAGDTRGDLPRAGDERSLLTAVLDWHRATFELKCAGVEPERLSERALPPSTMSLHGLVRHLAAVEQWSFRIRFAGEDVPMLYYSDEDPNQDFDDLEGDVAEAFTVWRREGDHARQIVDATAALDETVVDAVSREPLTLRALLVNMIAEYARHDGHADLLRERLDGATGY